MYESALFPFFGLSSFRCSALVSSRFLSSSGSRYLRLHTATAPLCTTVFLHFEKPKNTHEVRHSFTLRTEHRGLFSLWLHSWKILARTLLTHVHALHLYVTGTLVFLHLFVTLYATSTLLSTLASEMWSTKCGQVWNVDKQNFDKCETWTSVKCGQTMCASEMWSGKCELVWNVDKWIVDTSEIRTSAIWSGEMWSRKCGQVRNVDNSIMWTSLKFGQVECGQVKCGQVQCWQVKWLWCGQEWNIDKREMRTMCTSVKCGQVKCRQVDLIERV